MRRKIGIGIGLLVVLLAANTLAVNRERREAEADAGRLVEVGGHELQVRVDGRRSGRSLVLLHGLAGSIHVWNRLVPRLADRYRLVRVDLLGHGGSDKPREGYSPRDQADLVAKVLDELDVRQPVVVGHSLGGMVAVALAERQPERLRGVVAIGTPAQSSDLDLPAAVRMATVPVVGQALRRLATDGMVEDGLKDSLGEDAVVPEQFVADYDATTHSSFVGSYEKAEDWHAERPVYERAANSGLRVLALLGEEDEEIKPEEAISGWRRVPRVVAQLLRDEGHMPQWTDPERVAALIARFERGAASARAQRSADNP